MSSVLLENTGETGYQSPVIFYRHVALEDSTHKKLQVSSTRGIGVCVSPFLAGRCAILRAWQTTRERTLSCILSRRAPWQKVPTSGHCTWSISFPKSHKALTKTFSEEYAPLKAVPALPSPPPLTLPHTSLFPPATRRWWPPPTRPNNASKRLSTPTMPRGGGGSGNGDSWTSQPCERLLSSPLPSSLIHTAVSFASFFSPHSLT